MEEDNHYPCGVKADGGPGAYNISATFKISSSHSEADANENEKLQRYIKTSSKFKNIENHSYASGTGNKVNESIRELSARKFCVLSAEKTLLLSYERNLFLKRVDSQANILLREIEKRGYKFLVAAAEESHYCIWDKKSANNVNQFGNLAAERKLYVLLQDQSLKISVCQFPSDVVLMLMNNISAGPKEQIFHMKDKEDFKLIKMLQYIKFFGANDLLQYLIKKHAPQLFKKLGVSEKINADTKNCENAALLTVSIIYNLSGTAQSKSCVIFNEQKIKTRIDKEDINVLGRQNKSSENQSSAIIVKSFNDEMNDSIMKISQKMKKSSFGTASEDCAESICSSDEDGLDAKSGGPENTAWSNCAGDFKFESKLQNFNYTAETNLSKENVDTFISSPNLICSRGDRDSNQMIASSNKLPVANNKQKDYFINFAIDCSSAGPVISSSAAESNHAFDVQNCISETGTCFRINNTTIESNLNFAVEVNNSSKIDDLLIDDKTGCTDKMYSTNSNNVVCKNCNTDSNEIADDGISPHKVTGCRSEPTVTQSSNIFAESPSDPCITMLTESTKLAECNKTLLKETSINDQTISNNRSQEIKQNFSDKNLTNEVLELKQVVFDDAVLMYNPKVKEEKVWTGLESVKPLSDPEEHQTYNLLDVSESVDAKNRTIEFSQNLKKGNSWEKKELLEKEHIFEEEMPCVLWEILSKLESPFSWLPDIQVLSTPESKAKEDMILYLTEKEKEFARAKTNIFREIIVHLVLAYEKTCEDHLIEAVSDLSHCYLVLGNPQFIPSELQLDFEDIDINIGKGDQYFRKLKEVRAEAKNKSHWQNPMQSVNNVKAETTTSTILGTDTHLLTEKQCLEYIKCSMENGSIRQQIKKETNLNYERYHEVASLLLTSKYDTVEERVKRSNGNGEQDSYLHKQVVADSKGSNEHNVKCISATPSYTNIKPASNEVQRVISMKPLKQRTNQTEVKPQSTSFTEVKLFSSTNAALSSGKINCNREHAQILNDLKINSEMEVTPDIRTVERFEAAITEENDKSNAKAALEPQASMSVEEERKMGLIYVVNATVAFVAYFCKNYKESYLAAQVSEYQFKKLGKAGIATLLAIKGSMFLEYGLMGNKLALPYLQRALTLDPDYWEWNLLCGKVLGRLERAMKSNNGGPGDEELKLLEKAVKLNPKDASCLVHLANAYRSLAHFQHVAQMEREAKAKESMQRTRQNESLLTERANSQHFSYSAVDLTQKWRNPQNIAVSHLYMPLQGKDYLELANKMYLKALALEPHCPYNNARCAKGLWSMPYPYKEMARAQQAILHALTLAPSDSLVNHYAGMFYEHVGDKKNALECYKRATSEGCLNYPAEMSYINLKLKMSPPGSYKLSFHLAHLLHKYSSPHFRVQTFCLRGYHLYMVEKLIFQAIRNFAMAIITDPVHPILKAFRPGTYFGRYAPAVNIYDLLIEMVKKYKESTKHSLNDEYIKSVLELALSLRSK